MSDNSKSDNVIVEDSRIIRVVEDIHSAEEVLTLINSMDNIKKHIIDTDIISVEEKTLAHRRIKHIIHSGEFTESMAYDVTRLALDMAGYMLKKGIYSNDLLPHNYTLEDGKWILYDFSAFSVSSKKVKTQISGIFEISFAGYELLKMMKRSRLKHYFLNRIRQNCLIYMIPFKDWFWWFCKKKYTCFLSEIGLYKQMYDYLKQVQSSYDDKHTISLYKYLPDKTDKELFSCITKLITTDTEDIFCLGKFGADYALASNISFSKIVYLDNYEICDRYYNYVRHKKIPKISSAVLQPLINDIEIDDNTKYRALYDDFTKERFTCDCVVLDFDEIYDKNQCGVNEFLNIISTYTNYSLILKLNKNSLYFEEVKSILPSLFKSISVKDFPVTEIIEMKDKVSTSYVEEKLNYKNGNRMAEADIQNSAILKILNI